MLDSKKWWQSEGIWGGVAALVATVAGFLGYAVSAEDKVAIEAVLASIVAAVGSLFAIHGRIRASKRIE
jgi:hypothetical protein